MHRRAIGLGIVITLLATGLFVLTPIMTKNAAAQERSQQTLRTKQARTSKPNDESTPKVTPERPMSFWMVQKLALSKSILQSLTKGDFDKLAKSAEKMRVLGRLEALVRRKNPEYRSHLRSFELANQKLVTQAEKQNAEGAALAFNQLTSSCVSCHVLIRNEAK